MESQEKHHNNGNCELSEVGHRLVEDGKKMVEESHRLKQEARRLEEEAQRLECEGQHLEQEGRKLEAEHHESKEKDLFIFVNRIKFTHGQGVKKKMSVDEIARLVGLTSATAIVRHLICNDDTSDPLVGEQHIKAGDQFLVTRKCVEGGFHDRVESELSLLRESSQKVDLVPGPTSYVIYRDVPTAKKTKVDVIVSIPNGYPSAMIDRVGLPADSPLINMIKGSPQEIIQADGKSWRMISYHPHAGGGGLAWNHLIHGFHTYLSEVAAWLEVLK
jgi:hypothetical protein